MKFIKTKIIIPTKIHITILEKNKQYICIFYNDFFFYKIGVDNFSKNIFINDNLNTISLNNLAVSQYEKLYTNILMKFLFCWNNYFFAKFKFKGKGYRIFRRAENRFIKFFSDIHTYD